jgi:hypothetical protein
MAFPAVCRTGDEVKGTCTGHRNPVDFTGVWTAVNPPGATDVVNANDKRLILTGDKGLADCGHEFVAVGGSDDVHAYGLKLQRVGDDVKEPEGAGYTITGKSTTGSTDVTSN